MRVYKVPFDLSSVDAAMDIAEIKAASGRRVTLLGFVLGKMGSTSERLELEIVRSASGATSGSSPVTGGGSVTPAPVKHENVDAASSTCEVGNETRISGGSPVTIPLDAYDPSVGYDFVPTQPEEQLTVGAGGYLTIGLKSAPASGNSNLTGHVKIGED